MIPSGARSRPDSVHGNGSGSGRRSRLRAAGPGIRSRREPERARRRFAPEGRGPRTLPPGGGRSPASPSRRGGVPGSGGIARAAAGVSAGRSRDFSFSDGRVRRDQDNGNFMPAWALDGHAPAEYAACARRMAFFPRRPRAGRNGPSGGGDLDSGPVVKLEHECVASERIEGIGYNFVEFNFKTEEFWSLSIITADARRVSHLSHSGCARANRTDPSVGETQATAEGAAFRCLRVRRLDFSSPMTQNSRSVASGSARLHVRVARARQPDGSAGRSMLWRSV